MTAALTAALLVGGLALVAVAPRQAALASPDTIQALAAAIGLVLGTAAAFAGALATIRVADLALAVSERQERADAVEFLEDRFSRAAELYSSVLLELSAVSVAGLSVDREIPQFETEKLRESTAFLRSKMDEPANDALAAEIDYLDSALSALVSALRGLAGDDFASYCFERNLRLHRGKLDDLSERLVSMGISPEAARVSLSDLPDIIGLLEIARRKLIRRKLGTLMEARLYTNSADIPMFGMKYDNAAVRNFFFLGNLLFCRTEQLPDHRVYIASIGAAIIRDLAVMMPDGAAIRAALHERYSGLGTVLSSHKFDFDPRNVLSSHLAFAIEGAAALGDLYLLISHKPEPEAAADSTH